MRLFRSPSIILLGLWLAACSDKSSEGSAASMSAADSSGGASAESTGSPGGTTGSATSTDPTNASQPDPTTSTGDPSSPATGPDDTGTFLQQPDGGIAGQCDPTVQDCPDDQKCTAVSDAPGDPWGINICVPKMGDS